MPTGIYEHKARPLADRFWEKVDKPDDPTACWRWTGRVAAKRGGYGMFTVVGRNAPLRERWAHRVAWELMHGAIPAGLYVCHRCDNPPCVRPDHLFLGTQAENMADCKHKGRARGPSRHGEAHPQAKLCEADVLAILTQLRTPKHGLIADLARAYGVDSTTISCIAHGKTWRHLTTPPAG